MKQSKWDCSIGIILAGLMSFGVVAHATTPVAIVGGQGTGTNSYAALLPNLNGDIVPISNTPSVGNSLINSVAINSSGEGLIGGISDSNLYAAYVSSEGILTPLSIPTSNGFIESVSINQTGVGLIGGYNQGGGSGYLAYVLPDGSITTGSPSADVLESVAINDQGVGLIGGEGNYVFYAAYTSLVNGVVSIDALPVPSEDIGIIYTVAINHSGNGIVAGFDLDASTGYVALVAPNSITNANTLNHIIISTSAINSPGNCLIGGQDYSSSNIYAGYVTAAGTITPLFDNTFSGTINAVALNDAGVGLIGGQNGSNFYAAFVNSNQTLNPLFINPVAGIINTVAINQLGIGLIGGQTSSDSKAFLAVVAPNGTLTPIDVSNQLTINSVAMQLSQIVPQAAGGFGSAVNTQLTAIAALETRFTQQNRTWGKFQNFNTSTLSQNLSHLAFNETIASLTDANLVSNPVPGPLFIEPSAPAKSHSVWLEPFGNFIYAKQQGSIPGFSNEIGGALLGYDWQDRNYMLGALVGYAFNYAHYDQSHGHGKTQKEMLALYGAYYTDHFWVSTALWGGLYQLANTRSSLPGISSKANIFGWVLTPHLKLASPWAMDKETHYYVEPFAQFDWVNNWQNKYTESGTSGLNIQMPKIYNSLLQSEIGLCFYEKFIFGWGDFCLEEKLGYVNQAPFNVRAMDVLFVSSAVSFPVAVASTKIQNLGSFQLLSSFIPKNPAYPYGGFSFQTMANSSYQSYFVNVFTGMDF